jgi:hypothetical protein
VLEGCCFDVVNIGWWKVGPGVRSHASTRTSTLPNARRRQFSPNIEVFCLR